MLAAVLEGRQDVLLLSDVEPALLPRVLQLERLEVVPEAALPGPDDRDQAEVGQLVLAVDRALEALQQDRHVELLDHELDDLAGRRARGHVQLEARARGQAGLVGRVDLRNRAVALA